MRITRPRMSLDSMTTRFQSWKRQDLDWRNLQVLANETLEQLREWAQESGLAGELAELEHPTPPVAPQWEPTVRVRALRHYRRPGRTPHGVEIYEGAAGSIVDLPQSVAAALGPDTVERVPDTTPVRHAPLGHGMLVDED